MESSSEIASSAVRQVHPNSVATRRLNDIRPGIPEPAQIPAE